MLISEAINRLVDAHRANNFATTSVRGISRKCDRFAEHATIMHLGVNATPRAVNSFRLKVLRRHKAGEINLRTLKEYLVFTRRLMAVVNDEPVSFTLHRYSKRLTNNFFTNVGNRMAVNQNWRPPTKRHVLDESRLLFDWLIRHHHHDCSGLTLDIVKKYYLEKARKVTQVKVLRFALKRIFSFLREERLIDFDCDAIFSLRTVSRKRLLPPFNLNQLDKVVSSIDAESVVGARNKAMILLGATTGLRAVDIVNLSLKDIDWRKGVLNVVQKKTQIPLALPLCKLAGDAIKMYISRFRMKSDDDHIFLREKAPFKAVSRACLTKAFRVSCQNVGISTSGIVGFHSLRRAMGTCLVRSGEKMPMISQILGHTCLSSSERYISLDVADLRGCALNFQGIELTRGVL